jgi:hypothetical protein
MNSLRLKTRSGVGSRCRAVELVKVTVTGFNPFDSLLIIASSAPSHLYSSFRCVDEAEMNFFCERSPDNELAPAISQIGCSECFSRPVAAVHARRV